MDFEWLSRFSKLMLKSPIIIFFLFCTGINFFVFLTFFFRSMNHSNTIVLSLKSMELDYGILDWQFGVEKTMPYPFEICALCDVSARLVFIAYAMLPFVLMLSCARGLICYVRKLVCVYHAVALCLAYAYFARCF